MPAQGYIATLNSLLDSMCVLLDAPERSNDPTFHVDFKSSGACVISAALPGVTKQQISVRMQSGVLQVEVNAEGGADVKAAFRGKICKKYRLADTLDVGSISPSMREGVLRIEIQPLTKQGTSTSIEVN